MTDLLNSAAWLELAATAMWTSSFQASVLIFLVFAVRMVFRKWLHPRVQYALGFLVLIRLLLPWSPPSDLSIFNWKLDRLSFSSEEPTVQHIATPSTQGAQAETPLPPLSTAGIAPGARKPSPEIPWVRMLQMVWLLGVIVLLTSAVRQDRKFKRRMTAMPQLHSDDAMQVLQRAKEMMGVTAEISLIAGGRHISPALFGLRKPTLVLPAGLMERVSPPEYRFILLHELAHLKRRDILFNWVMIVVRALHWFNPLVWLAMNRLRCDRELVCDQMVLVRLDASERRSYGQTLLKLVEDISEPEFCPTAVPAIYRSREVKTRVMAIANFRPTGIRTVCVTVGLMSSLFVLTFTRAAQTATEPVVIVTGPAVDRPAASKTETEPPKNEPAVTDPINPAGKVGDVLNGFSLRDGTKRQVKQIALLSLAGMAEERGQPGQAIQLLAEYVDRYPLDPLVPEILVRQGLLYRRSKNFEVALKKFYESLRSALGLQATNVTNHARLLLTAKIEIAETLYEAGKFSDAGDKFELVLKDDGDVGSALNRRMIKLKLIRARSGEQHYGLVVRYAEEFLRDYPWSNEHIEVSQLLSTAYEKLGKPEESLRVDAELIQRQNNGQVKPTNAIAVVRGTRVLPLTRNQLFAFKPDAGAGQKSDYQIFALNSQMELQSPARADRIVANVHGAQRQAAARVGVVALDSDPARIIAKLNEHRVRLIEVVTGALGSETLEDFQRAGLKNLLQSDFVTQFNAILGAASVKEVILEELVVE